VRAVLLAIAVVTITGCVACGGDESEAQPLTMEQRLLRQADAPGSKVDPVETRLTARNLDEFKGWDIEEHVAAARIERDKLEEAGFVSAIHETRFYPRRAGGSHTRDARHVRMLVLRFESQDGAATGVDLLRLNGFTPCPGKCATSFEELDPSKVPDARGLRRFATARRLEELHEQGDPFDGYTIWFADGPFAYELEMFGPPGAVSEKQTEELARKVYDRVEGAPAP
jgi:hypothetical protein